LASAKALREVSPKPTAVQAAKALPATTPSKLKKPTMYEVGLVLIKQPQIVEAFLDELSNFLSKHHGAITFTHTAKSLAEVHREELRARAVAEIAQGESELKEIDIDQLRRLENA